MTGDIKIKIDYRNIKEAALEIYKVDLMKLYLREKNLSNITAVDLAGIDPESSMKIPLGDGADFADKIKKAKLPIKEEGAYLVICRGDDLFTSGLVLITPLKLEIQEDAAGSVRVTVRDTTAGEKYVPEMGRMLETSPVVGSMSNRIRTAEADTVIIAPARKQNKTPLTTL